MVVKDSNDFSRLSGHWSRSVIFTLTATNYLRIFSILSKCWDTLVPSCPTDLCYLVWYCLSRCVLFYREHPNQQLKKEFRCQFHTLYHKKVVPPTFRSTGYRSMAYTPSTGFGSLSDDKDAGSTVDSNPASWCPHKRRKEKWAKLGARKKLPRTKIRLKAAGME